MSDVPTDTKRCVHQGGPYTELWNVLNSLGQRVLRDLVPRRLETHYYFGEIFERDPFLWAFVRHHEDFAHERIFEAIIEAWFTTRADGVLQIDLSEEPGSRTKNQVTNSLKQSILQQLQKCPESIILIRHFEHRAGDGVAVPLVDFLHDVHEVSTDFQHNARGNKAIFILEIVVRENKEEILKLINEDDVHHDNISYMQRAQVLNEAIVKEYFGQWRATGTRLWVTWILELSQNTKYRIYRDKFRKLKQNLQNRGTGYHINFDRNEEEEHCNNLSPPKKGIKLLLEFLTDKALEAVLLSCPEGDRNLKWEVNGTSIVCRQL